MAYFTAPDGSIKRVSGSSSVAKASSPESTNSPNGSNSNGSNSNSSNSNSMCNGTIIFIGSGLLLLAVVVGVLMYRKRNQSVKYSN